MRLPTALLTSSSPSPLPSLLRIRPPKLPPPRSARCVFTSTACPFPRPRLRPASLSFILASTRPHSYHHHHGHGHGHGHSHSHAPDPFLTSKNLTDPGVRITRIGLYVNLAMAVSKGVGGWFFNSQALIADGFHALTDMVSDFMTLATVSFGLKAPTARFPNGYGKIEALGSLGVSSLLLMGGMAMGYASLLHLLGDFFPAIASILPHIHAHDHDHTIPSLNAAWLAAGSIAVKEWLYRRTMAIAVSKKSSVLASNAVHHRVDSLTAIVALAAIAGSNIWPATAGWMDPVGGILVAGMVVQAGARNTWAALEELADQGIDEDVREEVMEKLKKKKTTTTTTTDVVAVEGVKSGQNFLFTVTVRMRDESTVAEAKAVEDSVRAAVKEVPGAWRVGVRFVGSDGVGGARDEFVRLEEEGVDLTKKDI